MKDIIKISIEVSATEGIEKIVNLIADYVEKEFAVKIEKPEEKE